jgi:hypothetical protein
VWVKWEGWVAWGHGVGAGAGELDGSVGPAGPAMREKASTVGAYKPPPLLCGLFLPLQEPFIQDLLSVGSTEPEGRAGGDKVGFFGPVTEFFYLGRSTFVNYGAGALASCLECDQEEVRCCTVWLGGVGGRGGHFPSRWDLAHRGWVVHGEEMVRLAWDPGRRSAHFLGWRAGATVGKPLICCRGMCTDRPTPPPDRVVTACAHAS